MPDSKEKLDPDRTVEIHWLASKQNFSHFIARLISDVVKIDSALSDKYSDCFSNPLLDLGRFFFDLGHSGRGTTPFAQEKLEISGPTQETQVDPKLLNSEKPALKMIMSPADFLRQITPKVAEFFRQSPFYQTSGKSYETYIQALEDLATATQSWPLEVILIPHTRRQENLFSIHEINYQVALDDHLDLD